MRRKIVQTHPEHCRPGAFTLIEVLVVVAIIGLLVAILFPSLRKARDQARETVCASNLGQFGKGFYAYAAANRDFLCSGSFDPGRDPSPQATPRTNDGRDGPVDKVGWIADLVNSRTAFPAEALCPANEAKVNQKLAQGGGSAGPYTEQQAEAFIRRGYNSNYTQAWYMARTEVTDPNQTNYRRVWGKRGPLKTAYMTAVTPSRVPLLGDGGIELADIFKGQSTVKSLTDGPFEGPYSIQDYSDFGPAHGHSVVGDTQGRRLSVRDRAVILFADGHTDRFIDRVRNGQFRVIYNETYPLGTQEDLDAGKVFDGVMSMGRRSNNNWARE